MRNTHTVLTSACAMQCNAHIKVTDATRVKSSKVRTIMQHDRNAKLYAIANAIASAHCKVARSHDHGGKLLQLAKQSSKAKGSTRLQGEKIEL